MKILLKEFLPKKSLSNNLLVAFLFFSSNRNSCSHKGLKKSQKKRAHRRGPKRKGPTEEGQKEKSPQKRAKRKRDRSTEEGHKKRRRFSRTRRAL